MNIVILGCGLVGSAIAKDLVDCGYDVTVADIAASAYERVNDYEAITFKHMDLTESGRIVKLIEPFDLVIGAVPGFMGFDTLRTVIDCRKHVVDISFFPEDPFELDALAKERDVTAVVDCGVAPGLSHVLFGYLSRFFDDPHSLKCYVGGLPVVREKPFEYKIVFSAFDVIEEYTRPARLVENGHIVIKDALSELEALFFANIGTLEAFNSDGLRTLTHTLNVPNMVEKTLRFPGHAEKMKLLRDAGFFSKAEIEVGECTVMPLKVTAQVLFPQLKMKAEEQDFTILRVEGSGLKDGAEQIHTFEMHDRYDATRHITSMARTTGYTCSAVADLFLRGVFAETGIIPPEFLGRQDGFWSQLRGELEKRNILIQHTVKTTEDSDR